MIPSTRERVPLHTAEQVNAEIARQTEENVARLAPASPEAIDRRLAELEREWDIERVLEANAAIAVLVGVTLGASVHRKWFFFPAVVGGFLLQHAVQGWCPPLPILRRLGVRTAAEIDQERYALKALRGDFRHLSAFTSADHHEAVAQFEGEGGAVTGPELPDVPDQTAVSAALQAVSD
jgi:hypothetical protein